MTYDRLHDLQRCRNCGGPTGRWGWFEAESERVVYVICYDCLNNGTEPAVQVVTMERRKSNDISD